MTIGCWCALFVASVSYAAPPVDEVVAAYYGHRLIDQAGADLTLEQAYRQQHDYVSRLAASLGPRRGFKVAMTSLSSQQHFGLTEPLYGQFLQQMLLKSPAQLEVNFGARGLIEADLLVRVGDSGINRVANMDELLTHLDAVIPFIELPDPLWSLPLTAARLVAVNCGARYGVMGEPLILAADGPRQLREFQVALYDPKDVLLGAGSGSDLLGDPLAVVFWLQQRLLKEGIALQPGDLISLGSLTRPLPPAAGLYRAVYRGLDPAGPVTVQIDLLAGR